MVRKHDPTKNLEIEAIHPLRNFEVCPFGGIGIDWTGDIGFGQFDLYWTSDGKLHASTEHIDSNEDKLFTKKILELLVDQIIIDN